MIRTFSTNPIISFNTSINLNMSNTHFGFYVHQNSTSNYSIFSSSYGIFAPTVDRIDYIDTIFVGIGSYELGYVMSINDTCFFKKSTQKINILPILSLIYGGWTLWVGLSVMALSFSLLVLIGNFCNFKNDEPQQSLLGRNSSITKYYDFKKPPHKYWFFYMNRKDMIRNIGEEAYHLYWFRFLLFLILIFISVIVLTILIPIDGTEGVTNINDISSFSAANLPLNSPKLIAHLVIIIFIILMIIIFGILSRSIVPTLSLNSILPSHHTVKFSNLPLNRNEDEFKSLIYSHYSTENVNSIYYVYDLEKFSTAIIKNKSDIEIEQIRSNVKMLGIAYVTFSDSNDVDDCIKRFKGTNLIPDVVVEKAEEPDDIIWENVGVSKLNRVCRFCFLLFFTIILILLAYFVTIMVTTYNISIMFYGGLWKSMFERIIYFFNMNREQMDTITWVLDKIWNFIPTSIALLNALFFNLLKSKFHFY